MADHLRGLLLVQAQERAEYRRVILGDDRAGRPRGRTERVRAAVLAATRAELEAHGYAELSMERVAEIAGVAKSTVYRRWRDPVWRPAMLGLISAAVLDPRAAQALHDFFQTRNDVPAESVRHAVERGDLPPDTDPIQVIRSVGAPFYYRMLVSHEPIDESVAEQAAAAAIAAAKAGAYPVREA